MTIMKLADETSFETGLDEMNNAYADCEACKNPLPHCHCKCPYCGELNGCECALFDAATGG